MLQPINLPYNIDSTAIIGSCRKRSTNIIEGFKKMVVKILQWLGPTSCYLLLLIANFCMIAVAVRVECFL